MYYSRRELRAKIAMAFAAGFAFGVAVAAVVLRG